MHKPVATAVDAVKQDLLLLDGVHGGGKRRSGISRTSPSGSAGPPSAGTPRAGPEMAGRGTGI
jgi:hypothetical protein